MPRPTPPLAVLAAVAALSLAVPPAAAQAPPPSPAFAVAFGRVEQGDPVNAGARAVALDDAGNSYTSGYVRGTVDLDPADGPDAADTFTADGYDAFVASYDASGAYRWGFVLGGVDGGNFDIANGVATDGARVYVTGTFAGTVDFDPSDEVAEQTAVNGNDVFVAAYDAGTGALVWDRTSGGDGTPDRRDFDEGQGVATDGARVYVTGSNDVPSTGDRKTFVHAYDAATGDAVWTFTLASTPPDGGTQITRDLGRSVAVDGTGIYVTGRFNGTTDFDPGAGTEARTASGPYGATDAFLAAYDAETGAFRWVGTFGGEDHHDEGLGVAADGGRVFVTGYFEGTADFDFGDGTALRTSMVDPRDETNRGQFGYQEDSFVAAYDTTSGGLLWANAFGSPRSIGGTYTSDDGRALAVDGGRVHVVGRFYGTADLDPSDGVAREASSGDIDLYVAAYDEVTGAFASSFAIGGAQDDGPGGIAARGGRVVVTGEFRDVAEFDPGPGTLTRTLATGAFVAAYDPEPSDPLPHVPGPVLALESRGADLADAVATDEAGNRYVLGRHSAPIAFDPPGATARSETDAGVFVASYDAAGALRWGFSLDLPDIYVLRNTSYYLRGGGGVATDGDRVYVTGRFEGTADFDPGAGVAERTATGLRDAFVAAYDAQTGAFVWAFALGGPSRTEAGNNGAVLDADYDEGRGVAVGGGRVYVTGTFHGPADFDPGAGVQTLTTPENRDLAFLAAYDSATGAYAWAFVPGGTGSLEGRSLAASAGTVFAAGRFSGPADFDPGDGVAQLEGDRTYYLAAYDGATGAYRWANGVGGEARASYGVAVAADGDGVYTTGGFWEPSDFDPSDGVAELTPAGSDDVFLAAYDAQTGAYRWAGAISGLGREWAYGVATGSGRVYVAGGFAEAFVGGVYTEAVVDFDPSDGVAMRTATGDGDGFVAAYDAGSGAYAWATALGGLGEYDAARAVAHHGGRVVALGEFAGTADFGTGPGALPRTAAGGYDVFLADLDAAGPVAADPGPGQGGALALGAPSPNPTRGVVRFDLSVSEPQRVRAGVFDALGREVAVLVDGMVAGSVDLALDTSALSPGVYVVRVTGEHVSASRRLTVVR